jgi:tetratricopeptide (TPR) repeat protein
MRGLRAILAVVLLVGVPEVASAQQAAPAAAPTTKKDREKRAESAFISGRYQEAAELLNGLYAEFHNPVYLRNLGRCHQRLKDPDRAIAAFDEYLRRAKGLTPAEREEVSGFIREMEALKKEQTATAAPPPPPPPPVPLTPAAPQPAPAPAVVPPAQTVETTPAPPSKGSGKLVGGILLGAAALMAAGGGVMMASSWSEFNRGKRQGCPAVFDCPQIANRVEQRALWGKILFGAAAATGIAGGTVLILSLSKSSASASTGWNVALQGNF